VEDFPETMDKYFYTSPAIRDKTGLWRLVIRQAGEGQLSFGLIATDIAKNVITVDANVEICVSMGGRDLVPDLKDIKFVHKYECEGDCGYSQPISINFKQLKNDKLDIKCRIYFNCRELMNIHRMINFFTNTIQTNNANRTLAFWPAVPRPFTGRQGNLPCEVGTIYPENKFCPLDSEISAEGSMLTGTELEGCKTTFLKHPETKTFFWKIPNFSNLVKNVDCWEISSPQVFVNSHGFCSIWRLKLIEMHGVFHIRMQLRGLPKGVAQIKSRHLLQLVDNFGDCVIPEHCGTTNKFPEYFHNWDTCRISLYRRETILERFTSIENVLTLRISLQCEPNDTVKIDKESADWILQD